MTNNEYKCAVCKGVFQKGWSDEEATKEATEVFGKHPDEWNDEVMTVCDDCYNTMMSDPRSNEAIKKSRLNI